MTTSRRSAGQLIEKGPRKWLLRIYLGRDEADKRTYHAKTVTGSRKDAQAELTRLLHEQGKGTFTPPTKQTLNQHLDDWLEEAVRPRVRVRTHQGYQALVDRYVRPTLGRRRLSTIQTLDLQRLYNGLSKKGLSPQTVRQVHACVFNALRQAVRWQKIPMNPAEHVVLPRRQHREIQCLSADEVERFLKVAEDDRLYAYYVLAIHTGMRPGELLGLKWKDVDWKEGRLRVRRTLVGQATFEAPKTEKGKRVITLGASVVLDLRRHRTRQHEERLAAGADYEDLGLVFASRTGRPIDSGNLRRRGYKRLLTEAGLPQSLTLYGWRHAAASLALLAGIHPKVVAERLGHSSIEITLDTYSHVMPDLQREAADKLDQILAPKRQG